MNYFLWIDGKEHGPYTAEELRKYAADGGLIAFVKDEDRIEIDALNRTMTLKISEEEIAARRVNWIQPELKAKRGLLYKYAKTVSTAAEGCVTDEM